MLVLFNLVLLSYSVKFVWTAAEYVDCGSKLASIESIDITDCIKPPCLMKKDHTYTIDVKFRPNTGSSSATLILHGVMGGHANPVAIPEPNICKLGATCPISQQDNVKISMSMPILSSYPALAFEIKLEIKSDDHNENYVCVLIPVAIVDNDE